MMSSGLAKRKEYYLKEDTASLTGKSDCLAYSRVRKHVLEIGKRTIAHTANPFTGLLNTYCRRFVYTSTTLSLVFWRPVRHLPGSGPPAILIAAKQPDNGLHTAASSAVGALQIANVEAPFLGPVPLGTNGFLVWRELCANW